MSRIMPTAIYFSGFVTVVWMILLALVIVMPQAGMTISPRFFLLLALFAVIFCTRFAARHYASRQTVALTSRDVAIFTVAVTLIVWIVAMAYEAVFVWSLMQDAGPLTLSEAILAPLSERYTITTVWTLGFADCAAIVSAIACVIFFPARVAMAMAMGRGRAD